MCVCVYVCVYVYVCDQLGDGTDVNRNTPPTVDVITGASAVAAGDAHICVLMTTGGVRCWGQNTSGQASAVQRLLLFSSCALVLR